MEGPGADSEEKRVLASDLDTVMVDSLKALDLIRPIREADIGTQSWNVRFVAKSGLVQCSKKILRRTFTCARWPYSKSCWRSPFRP